jgi:hypothetical protein
VILTSWTDLDPTMRSSITGFLKRIVSCSSPCPKGPYDKGDPYDNVFVSEVSESEARGIAP